MLHYRSLIITETIWNANPVLPGKREKPTRLNTKADSFKNTLVEFGRYYTAFNWKSFCTVAKTYTIDHSVLYQTSLILREFGCIDNSCLLACSKLQQNYDLLAKNFYGPANLNILKVSWEQRGNLSNVSNQNVSVCHDLSSLFLNALRGLESYFFWVEIESPCSVRNTIYRETEIYSLS